MKIANFFLILFIFTFSSLFSLQDSPLSIYNKGEKARMEGDNYSAVEYYLSALELNPHYIDPIIGLSKTFFSLEEYNEALKYNILAREYDKTGTGLLLLEGRIRIALGEFDNARILFSKILEKEPGNIEAGFGLAELDIISGKILNAAEKYLSALRSSPENRRALLSLVLLFDTIGESERSEEYIRQALHYYPEQAGVRYVAAKHYFTSGEYNSAEYQAKAALELNPDFVDAALLLCNIFHITEQYNNVISLFESETLKQTRDSNLLWYILGRAYDKIGNPEMSIYCYNTSLRLIPDDSITRIALDNMLIGNRSIPFDHPSIISGSDYHFQAGRAFQADNFFSKAFREYRMGLILNPYSSEGRLLYAELFRLTGYSAKYLSILTLIMEEGNADRDILESIEIYESILSNSVALKWDIDQFDMDNGGTIVERYQYSISPFYFTDIKSMEHLDGEKELSEYFQRIMTGYENINIQSPVEVKNFADAFRIARESGNDFFIIMKYHETSRNFNVICDVYRCETGILIESIKLYKADTIPDTMAALGEQLHEIFPLRGAIISNNSDTSIIDLGILDGVNIDDIFLVLKKGDVTLRKDYAEFSYSTDSILGKITITDTDELVSEGILEENGFFSRINQGDIILSFPKENKTEEINTPESEELQNNIYEELSREILRIP